MAEVLMVIGALFVLYLIGLGVVEHCDRKKVPDIQDSNDQKKDT